MPDSGVILQVNRDRVPSRLKRTGDISFASAYSARRSSSSSSSSSSVQTSSLFTFDFFVGISQLFLFAFCGTLAFVFGSTSHYIQFNNNAYMSQNIKNLDFKALLFIFGLVITQGEALMIYRVHRHEMKFINNVLHSLFNIAGLVFAILLLIAMVQHKNLNGETYFATFQAWISLIVIAGFIIQSAFTVVNVIFPKHTRNLRNSFDPGHKVFGVSIFISSVLLVIIGMQQYTGVLGDCYDKFNCSKSLGAWLNCGILAIIGYCITITALTTNFQWKTKPTIEEKRI